MADRKDSDTLKELVLLLRGTQEYDPMEAKRQDEIKSAVLRNETFLAGNISKSKETVDVVVESTGYCQEAGVQIEPGRHTYKVLPHQAAKLAECVPTAEQIERMRTAEKRASRFTSAHAAYVALAEMDGVDKNLSPIVSVEVLK